MTAIFIFLCFCIPISFLTGFYIGFKLSKSIFTVKDIVPVTNIKTENFESEQERIQRILTENVENFGTDIPQKEVK